MLNRVALTFVLMLSFLGYMAPDLTLFVQSAPLILLAILVFLTVSFSDRVLTALESLLELDGLLFVKCYEGFPAAVTEAYACGVPVIASRLGAMTEIVEAGRTGLHFRPGDGDDLAAKMGWAWSHPEAMREMGRAARAKYESKYTADENYQRLVAIYEKAKREGRTAPPSKDSALA